MRATEDFHDALHEGVPVWMEAPLADWFERFIHSSTLTELVLGFDAASHNAQPFALLPRGSFRRLRALIEPESVIDFLDYVIFAAVSHRILGITTEQALGQLASLLAMSGSAWAVGTRAGLPGLERRVPEGVQQAADETISATGSAGQLLSEAWHAAFGRSPDPEDAYEKAIKAVEEAGAPVVLPNSSRATLGTMLDTMGQHGDWETCLVDRNGDPFSGTVHGMCRALWQGQPSRHGANGYRKPTQEEAEAAVMLAVPLVYWFHSKKVARRP